jgi:hypothetical protein
MTQNGSRRFENMPNPEHEPKEPSHRPLTLAESDVMMIYAKLNAHEAILRAIVRSLSGSDAMLEVFRAAAMEEGDILKKPANDPNPEITDEGTIQTLKFIVQTFERLKGE